MNNLILPHNTPLKCDCPSLEFDITNMIKVMLKDNTIYPLPKHLKKLKEKINYYLNSNIKLETYTSNARIYILDQRLNLVFVLFSNESERPTYISRFRAHFKDDERFSFYYIYDTFFNNPTNTLEAIKTLECTPVESLNCPTIAFYEYDSLKEIYTISNYEVHLLIEKFREYNMIDWENILSNYILYKPYKF